MKIQKKTLIVGISTFFSIVIASYLWDFIKLPYYETEIIGEYSINKYNANNEILRYLFFILFPVLIFLILQIIFNKITFYNLISQINIKKNKNLDSTNFNHLIKFIVIFLILLEFFSIDFTVSKLDLFHEGQKLSSAYKSYLDGSLWSGSYVTISIFYETLSSKLIWNLFDQISIGLMRFAEIFYILICKILLVLIIFKIAQFSKLKSHYKNLFFIICSLILTQKLFDYNIERNDAEYLLFREFPILLLCYLFFIIISKKEINKIAVITIGALSILSILWSIDRGIICNILIFFIFFYFLLIKDFLNSLLLLSSALFFWALSSFFLGNEFNFFLNNTLSVLKEINYIHGVIHAQPFSSDIESLRFSKVLIAIILCLIISLNIFIKNKDYASQFKLAMLFIAIISFFTYGYNIGRSGGVHLKEVFGYSIMFLTLFYINNFFFYIQNKKFSIRFKKIYNNYILFFTIMIFTSLINVDLQKINKFNQRFSKYINLNDSFFLSDNENIFLEETQNTIDKYNCVQLFTNEVAFLYLWRTKNCSKYYLVFALGSHNIQKKLINDLKNTDLIFSTKYDDLGHPSYKLPIVNQYIKNNYVSHISQFNKIILKKK